MAKFPPRQNSGSDGPSNYLKIKDGSSVSGILMGEMYSYWQTGFGQTAKLVGVGEGKERFRHNMAVKENDEYVMRVWEFGPKIYDILSALDEAGWDLNNTVITISRVGSTKENTKYTVTPNKKEPPAATMKAIAGLELNKLEHRLPSEKQELKNYVPSDEDGGDLPF